MDDDRLAQLKRLTASIDTEAELQGVLYQLEFQGELNGVTRHYIETRRKEIQTGKRVRA